MSDYKKKLYESNLHEETHVQTANIKVAYKQRDLIKYLKKRGELLKSSNYTNSTDIDNIQSANDDIKNYIENNHDTLMTPITAFVTFTT